MVYILVGMHMGSTMVDTPFGTHLTLVMPCVFIRMCMAQAMVYIPIRNKCMPYINVHVPNYGLHSYQNVFSIDHGLCPFWNMPNLGYGLHSYQNAPTLYVPIRIYAMVYILVKCTQPIITSSMFPLKHKPKSIMLFK